MTPVDVIERLHREALAACGLDDRQPPENGRRGQFKRGWVDAVVRGRRYGDEALSTLTWCNLGYRFGLDLRVSAAEEIEHVWAYVAAKYQADKQRA